MKQLAERFEYEQVLWSVIKSPLLFDLNHTIADCWSATKTMLADQTSLVTLAEGLEGKQVRLFA